MQQCDVVVIGAGPGGYVAAIRAAQRGAKVIVVERKFLGGVCLNVGCIPTKTLIHTAELYKEMQQAEEFGIKAGKPALDMKALLQRKGAVVGTNTGGIKALFKAHGIKVVNGEAQVAAPGVVKVDKEEIRARSIIIATGGRPAQLEGLEFDGEVVIGSTRALELDYVPKSVCVIGAGALGAEFACVWNALGAEVTLVEALDHVLPKEDEELSKRAGALWKKAGMDVRTGTKVTSLKRKKKGATIEMEGKKPGKKDVELVLVGIGLQCNSEVATSNPGLGVKVGPRGGILVNERMETNVPGIYAIGDVIDRTWLAHGASTEGIVAATNATGGDKRMDYRVLPSCNFTMPEVASVGMTEREAREKGVDVKTGSFPFMANGRAHAIGRPEGMVKIVGDASTDEIVGMHIMGPEAGELIAVGALAMSMEATVDEVINTIHTHPTLSEAILEAAEDYHGMGIHTRPKKKK